MIIAMLLCAAVILTVIAGIVVSDNMSFLEKYRSVQLENKPRKETLARYVLRLTVGSVLFVPAGFIVEWILILACTEKYTGLEKGVADAIFYGIFGCLIILSAVLMTVGIRGLRRHGDETGWKAAAAYVCGLTFGIATLIMLGIAFFYGG